MISSSSSLRIPIFSSLRCLHTSTCVRHLVGQPHPISNIRPAIYDDGPPQTSPVPFLLRHPYSLSEFNVDAPSQGGQLELLYKLKRQQLDAYDQEFWLDHNTRFDNAKAIILSSLPPTSTPIQKERTLSLFYQQWMAQESKRTKEYTATWRKRNFEIVTLGVRVQYQKFKSSFSHWPFKSQITTPTTTTTTTTASGKR